MPFTKIGIAKRWRPLRLAAKIALATFVSEAVVMLLLNHVLQFSHIIELIIDPLLLIIILTPTLYFYVITPMKWTIAQKETVETTLDETEERFKSAIVTAGDAVIGIEPPGTINLWNKKAEEIFGYSQEEALGKDMHNLIVPARYHPNIRAGLKNFSQTGAGPVLNKHLEVTALRRTGEEFEIELSVSANRINGVWNAIGIIRDISDRKKLEAESLQNLNEAERMNRLMVGRELKMEEYRQEIAKLRAKVRELENNHQPETESTTFRH